MSQCSTRTKNCSVTFSARNKSNNCSIKPSYGGGTITPTSPVIEDTFLIDQLFNFIVTEANEKLIIGQRQVGGKFAATIFEPPTPIGSITQGI